MSSSSRTLIRPASIEYPVCVVERSLGHLFRGWPFVVETDIRNPNLNGITPALREADFVTLTGPEAEQGPWPSSLQLRMVAAPGGR